MNIVKNNELVEEYPCILYFTASWCGPCKKISPCFEKLAQENTDVHFYKIDVDENEKLTVKYNVNAMPTFICFESNTSSFGKFSGADEKLLKSNVNKLKNKKA